MKVVTGVSALGGNGGLLIPLKAQRLACFAWSVICNCGISWEALEQSTLCSNRAPSAKLKSVREKSKKDNPTNSVSFLIFIPLHRRIPLSLSLTLSRLFILIIFTCRINITHIYCISFSHSGCLVILVESWTGWFFLFSSKWITLMQTGRSNCDEYLMCGRNISLFNLHQHKGRDRQSSFTNRTECPSPAGSALL